MVGVTGHRFLAEPEKIRAGVRASLERISKQFPGRSITAVSALAEGADRMVAREVIRRPSGRLVVVLPFDAHEYMKDFATADSKHEFAQLLERAHETIEMKSSPDRESSYEAAGDYIIDASDALIAIWDGQEMQGKGGTAGDVARARERGMPIAWIKAGNRQPGTSTPTSLGKDQGTVVYENL